IFTPGQLSKALKLDAYTMQSSVFINNRKGAFSRKALPAEAQFSPMYGIAAEDFDKDGNTDIVMGGNFYESKPEAGIYDASYGVFLKGDGNGNFEAAKARQIGLNVRGAIRNIEEVKVGNKKMLMVSLNNSAPKFFKVSNN
ncbi:MAG TPA: VCBS repeat-containing protein, partial [Segetibacter sp.]|nr:VCBS repeat-containing protein [Segetibacter sp.]